jgi:succinate dehydrogenase/fumarate reductase flavoprotein subunit
MQEQQSKKVIIIGGGPAGLTAVVFRRNVTSLNFAATWNLEALWRVSEAAASQFQR